MPLPGKLVPRPASMGVSTIRRHLVDDSLRGVVYGGMMQPSITTGLSKETGDAADALYWKLELNDSPSDSRASLSNL